MSAKHIFTYQARPALLAVEITALDAYAELYGSAERSAFAALCAGKRTVNELKRDFQRQFGISARQFNALRVGIEGKIASIKERRPDLIVEAEGRIAKAKRVIAKIEGSIADNRYPAAALKCGRTVRTMTAQQRQAALTKDRATLHQKKRRLTNLETRTAALKADHAAETVRLCFGSKRLFRAQFDLAANGYESHEDWKIDWARARSSQFFVLGSQDETAGCQGCQASVAQDGSLTMQLRLPDALALHGKHVVLTNVWFAYGHETIVAALSRSKRIHSMTKAGKATIKRTGSALSYRFVRDDKGWRIFVSVDAPAVERVSHRALGAIGVDVNAYHLAASETDRFGNLISTRRIDLPLYGKSTDQAKAIIGDAVAHIAAHAKEACKPIVIEKLNFQRKKAELEKADPRTARMLSSFACNKISAGIKAAAFRAGVEVIEVNPAYTSVIGAVNHAQRKGISVHLGAAYAIARRGLGLSERPAVRGAVVPTRRGEHVTFDLPARNRAKHVWSFWSSVRTRLTAAHVAHSRCKAIQPAAPPPSPARPIEGATRETTAKLRGASSQHCSESGIDDVPW
jgi:IS605 OrfB family transposase